MSVFKHFPVIWVPISSTAKTKRYKVSDRKGGINLEGRSYVHSIPRRVTILPSQCQRLVLGTKPRAMVPPHCPVLTLCEWGHQLPCQPFPRLLPLSLFLKNYLEFPKSFRECGYFPLYPLFWTVPPPKLCPLSLSHGHHPSSTVPTFSFYFLVFGFPLCWVSYTHVM